MVGDNPPYSPDAPRPPSMLNVRRTVLTWDENATPTIEQLQAALVWWRVSTGRPAADAGKCRRLLDRFQPVPPLR